MDKGKGYACGEAGSILEISVPSPQFEMRNMDKGKGYACVEAGSILEISVPSPQFAVNLKLL